LMCTLTSFPSTTFLEIAMLISNGPEYEARLKKPFTPPTVTLKEIHDAVPKELLGRDPILSASYIARDVFLAVALVKFASLIGAWAGSNFFGFLATEWQVGAAKASLWLVYWWFQGLVLAGLFCLGHDAGHGTLFQSGVANNTIGFILHTSLLTPYFAWRSTHHAHHKATGSMERDENYIPHLRSHYNLPEEKLSSKFDYAELFDETPIYTLSRMLVMQGFGWWLYLTFNSMGSKMYPPGTNHWNPSSPLFNKSQRKSLIVSNIALCCTVVIFVRIGLAVMAKYYLVPYLLMNHWIVMFTYLHHSDPTIPHYRKEEWSFLRGAAATVDRPLLGWMGRFFLHNISHDHVAHHFFVGAPFYNGPQITERIKAVLKDDYNYDSTNSFYALYRTFTQCLFVEEEGGIVFYKNKEGKAVREVERTGGSTT